MRRKSVSTSNLESFDIDGALAAMSTEELRGLVRDLLSGLEVRARQCVIDMVIERAARSGSGWAPVGPSADSVAEIVAFAAAARREGYAEPAQVDDYLRQGSAALAGKDYQAALQIFGALLPSISTCDIDLGQEELVSDVLSVDVTACAAQYALAVYRTTAAEHRARAVLAAIHDVNEVGYIWEPVREMERVSVEPLPELEPFLSQWRALLEESSGPDSQQVRWLREVAERLEGAEGLAKIARSSRSADDALAWCRVLVDARDWQGALAAHEEALELIGATGNSYVRGELLDGAALAARELGRQDVPERLERAWRGVPDLVRLCRWLATATSRATVRRRAAQALEACPRSASRQRALLHVLVGEHEAAAELLAAAPGLGWSICDHPGPVLFPLFYRLLGGRAPSTGGAAGATQAVVLEEYAWMSSDPDQPRLATPDLYAILEMAGVSEPKNARARAAMLEAMRSAAGQRVAGVTENKRRRHYGHAAQLVAACAAVDASPENATWVASIRGRYRRYPALQSELDHHLGRG